MDPEKLTLASLDARLKRLETEKEADGVAAKPIHKIDNLRVCESGDEDGYLFIYMRDGDYTGDDENLAEDNEVIAYLSPDEREELKALL